MEPTPNNASQLSPESWPNYVAYDLGRTVRQIADGASATVKALDAASSLLRSLERRWLKRRGVPKDPRVELKLDPRARAKGARAASTIALALDDEGRPVSWRSSIETIEDLGRDTLSVLGSVPDDSNAAFVAIASRSVEGWDELRTLADASGVTAALHDAKRALLRHDDDPVLARIADRLESLGDEGRKAMGRRFIERLGSQPAVLALSSSTVFRPIQIRPAELDGLALATAQSARAALEELGLSDAEIAHVSSVATEVVAPLAELAELYMRPRTPMAHVKRYFRLQRIGFAALRIASRPSFEVETLRPPARGLGSSHTTGSKQLGK